MQKTHAERVAASVRAEVARRKVTQQQLADLLGIHQMSVSRRLNGHTEFTASEIALVADFLGVPVATLIGEAA